jgi:hypothetical protein
MANLFDFYTNIAISTPTLINKIPKDYKTKEFYQAIVEKEGRNIYYVPPEFITQELCDLVVNGNKSSHMLAYIPDNYITQEMCIQIIKQERLNADVFIHIPDKIMETLIDLIIEIHPECFRYIDTRFINKRFYEEKIKTNKEIYDTLPELYKQYFEIGPDIAVGVETISVNENGDFVDKDGNIYTAICFDNDKTTTNLSTIFTLKGTIYLRHKTLRTNRFDIHYFIDYFLSHDGMLLRFIPKENQINYMKLIAVNQNKDAIKFT